MKINVIKKLFHRPDIKGIPSIDAVLDEAEQSPKKDSVLKNLVPRRLKKIRDALGDIPEIDGRRYVTMEDIEKLSPLLAHEIKRVILGNLLEMGFDVYNYNDFKVRYGRKVSYNYYFLNLKPQSNLEDNKLTLIQDYPVKIKSPEVVEMDFASPVIIKGEEIIVFYSLILGVTDLEEVKL